MSDATSLSLPGLGPDAADGFRFTWWNTRDGARVWIERRGNWREGIIVGRGREHVEVLIASPSGRPVRVRRLYAELRRVR